MNIKYSKYIEWAIILGSITFYVFIFFYFLDYLFFISIMIFPILINNLLGLSDNFQTRMSLIKFRKMVWGLFDEDSKREFYVKTLLWVSHREHDLISEIMELKGMLNETDDKLAQLLYEAFDSVFLNEHHPQWQEFIYDMYVAYGYDLNDSYILDIGVKIKHMHIVRTFLLKKVEIFQRIENVRFSNFVNFIK